MRRTYKYLRMLGTSKNTDKVGNLLMQVLKKMGNYTVTEHSCTTKYTAKVPRTDIPAIAKLCAELKATLFTEAALVVEKLGGRSGNLVNTVETLKAMYDRAQVDPLYADLILPSWETLETDVFERLLDSNELVGRSEETNFTRYLLHVEASRMPSLDVVFIVPPYVGNMTETLVPRDLKYLKKTFGNGSDPSLTPLERLCKTQGELTVVNDLQGNFKYVQLKRTSGIVEEYTRAVSVINKSLEMERVKLTERGEDRDSWLSIYNMETDRSFNDFVIKLPPRILNTLVEDTENDS